MKHLYISILFVLSASLLYADKRPNILLIVADDMGYGDLSCYGSKQISTPHLDKLAANGVRCTDGYVSNAVCASSRSGILTGRYGSRFGFEHNLSKPDFLKPEFAGIPLDEPLISDRLKKLGYRTGMVGKWHLGESVAGHHPNARGFGFFFGMLGGSHGYWPKVNKNKLLFNREKPTEVRTPYLTDWFTLEAIDFINAEGKAGMVKNIKKEAPWFLYLSYNTPHSPMQAKEEDMEKFSYIHHKTRRIYCAMQHCMDENIGKIIANLEKNKQLENTLIVFISDNGGSVEVSKAVNAPLRGTKGTFLEGGVRIPTIYHWPAKLKASVYTKPVISLDFMATFVNAAGGIPPEAGKRTPRKGRFEKKAPIYDSVDLIPFFNGEKQGEPHEFLAWRAALRGDAIRMGDWKLLMPASQETQLYNLKEDISETNNLVAKHPDILKRLLKRKIAWQATFERVPMFMSVATWSLYNEKLYAKKYSLVQPEKDSKEDLWSLK